MGKCRRLSELPFFSDETSSRPESDRRLADAFERGEWSLGAYLDQVVFHWKRAVSRDAFVASMRSRSLPHRASPSVIGRLASVRLYRLGTIDNESRELNRYRIDTSCYIGGRKPDARIYEIALDFMQIEATASWCMKSEPAYTNS